MSHEVIIVCITLSPPSLHLFFHPIWSHLWHLWVLKVLPDKKETCVAPCVYEGERICSPLSLCGVIICSLSMIDHSWDFLNILFCVFLCVCSECWHGFVVFLAFLFACDIFATHFPFHKVSRISMSDIWLNIIIKYILVLARLAQSVEHETLNLRVVSVKLFWDNPQISHKNGVLYDCSCRMSSSEKIQPSRGMTQNSPRKSKSVVSIRSEKSSWC